MTAHGAAGSIRPDDRTSRTPHPGPPDAGVATVWAAVGVVVLLGLMTAGLDLGAAVAARHRAAAAADLAALAAAGNAVHGAEVACGRARHVAVRMDGAVTLCTVAGWEAFVEVTVSPSLRLLGLGQARARARAGPVDADPTPAELPAERSGLRPTAGPRAPPSDHAVPGEQGSRPTAGRRLAKVGRSPTGRPSTADERSAMSGERAVRRTRRARTRSSDRAVADQPVGPHSPLPQHRSATVAGHRSRSRAYL